MDPEAVVESNEPRAVDCWLVSPLTGIEPTGSKTDWQADSALSARALTSSGSIAGRFHHFPYQSCLPILSDPGETWAGMTAITDLCLSR